MADVVEPGFSYGGETKYVVEPGFSYGGETKYVTKDKRAILVDALYELRVSGRFVGSEFTMEYVHAVRQLIGPDLFTSVRCLRKIMMHIRANFRIVQRILATSGFSWDPKKSCVVADDHVWDAYIKTHQIVGRWRCQPFPYYDKLCIIFGDDRSRGFQTNVLEGERGQISNETMGFKRKKYETSDLSKSCEESLEKKNNAIGDLAQTLTEKLATLSVNEATDLMDKVMTQMNDLSTLTVDKRLKTMSVIGRRAPLSFMYDRLNEDEKTRMAQLVARGYIS